MKRIVLIICLTVSLAGCRETKLIYTFRVSPNGENVAFVRGDALYVMELSGEGKTIVVEKSDVGPDGISWSPDSTRLAYCKTQNRTMNILEYDLDAGRIRTLIDHKAKDTAPVHDRTGAVIIFRSYRDLKGDLYSLDIDTRTLKRLTFDDACESAPSTHPKKDLAAYASMSFKSSRVFVINTKTGVRTELAGPWRSGRHVEFSPDGSMLLVEDSDGLYVCSEPWTDPGGRLTKAARLIARGRWARWDADGGGVLYSAKGRVWRKGLLEGSPRSVSLAGTIKLLPSPVPGKKGFIYVTDETGEADRFRATLLAWRKQDGHTRWFLPKGSERETLERASRAAARDGKLQEAARLLEQAEGMSKIEGERDKFAFKRARLQERLERYKEAANTYRALGMWMESARIALVYIKDFDAAKADVGKASPLDRAKQVLFVVAVENEDHTWLAALADTIRLEADGEINRAEKAYANLASSANPAEAKAFSLFLLARLQLHKRGSAAKALESAASALKLVTDENSMGLLHLIRGEALRRLGRGDEAIRAFIAAIQSCTNPQKRLAAFERGVYTATSIGRFDLVEKIARSAAAHPLGDSAAMGRALGKLTAALDAAERHDLANALGFELIDAWQLLPMHSAHMLRWSGPELKALLVECRILEAPKWLRQRTLKVLQADPLYTPLVDLFQKVFSKESPINTEFLRTMIKAATEKLKEKGIRANALDFGSGYILANLFLNRADMARCLQEIVRMGKGATILPDYAREALRLSSRLSKFADTKTRRQLKGYYAMQRRSGLGIWKRVGEYLSMLEARDLQTLLQTGQPGIRPEKGTIREKALLAFLRAGPPAWLEDNVRYWLLVSRFEALRETAAKSKMFTADPAWLGPREELFVKAWAETMEFLTVYPTSEMFGAAYLNCVDWLVEEQNATMALALSRKLLGEIDSELAADTPEAKPLRAKNAGPLIKIVTTDTDSQSGILARIGDLLRDLAQDHRRALRYYLKVHNNFRSTRVWNHCTWRAAGCHEELAKPLVGNVDRLKNDAAISHLEKALKLLSKLDEARAKFLRPGERRAFQARLHLALGKAGKREAARKADALYVRLFAEHKKYKGLSNLKLLAEIVDHLSDEALREIGRICADEQWLTRENFEVFDRWQKMRLERLDLQPQD